MPMNKYDFIDPAIGLFPGNSNFISPQILREEPYIYVRHLLVWPKKMFLKENSGYVCIAVSGSGALHTLEILPGGRVPHEVTVATTTAEYAGSILKWRIIQIKHFLIIRIDSRSRLLSSKYYG